MVWLLTTGLALLLSLASSAAWAIDGNLPTITSVSDIVSRRAALINQAWGASTLPTTLPTVTTGISNPFPSYNVARVDRYVASMSNGQSNTSNFYTANSPNNNRAVIFNPGHQADSMGSGTGNCNWTVFPSGERLQPMLQALLAAGYNVFAMNMPDCGSVAGHNTLFGTYGNTAMSYFFEPAVQAMNYWDTNYSFRDYNMIGLSGGGWTTTILPAVDTRIKISIPVAGSWPGIWNQLGQNPGDLEENWTNWYTVAGYIDLYIMASYGPNRRQFQILNYSDNCCFGNTQFNSFGAPAFYGVSFERYYYNWIVSNKQLEATIRPFNYDGMVDYISNQHQISTNAQSVILSILASTGPGSAGGGRRLFHMR